jgi:hypothetical protein
VDHYQRQNSQATIEAALSTVLPGGGANYENTAWDRYNVRVPSSTQASFGRPRNTQYGAEWDQIIGYNCIIWNTGPLDAGTMTKEDGEIFIPWMTLTDFDFKNFYGSGNGLVKGIVDQSGSELAALRFIEDLAGVTLTCNTYREDGCPSGKSEDLTGCLNLDPVGGALVANGGRLEQHTAQGNDCPAIRSFDVLGTVTPDFGASVPDERYNTGQEGNTDYASIANDAGLDDVPELNYKTVFDGGSIHYRRDGDSACAFGGGSANNSITERLAEVLAFLGHDEFPELCSDPTEGTGAPDDPRVSPRFNTTLANFAPNPLMTGVTGRIQFTMSREGKATIDIFDVNGRLVRSVYDGIAKEGINEAFWNGSDEAGRQVVSGVYFYRLHTNAADVSRKMIVVRNGGN